MVPIRVEVAGMTINVSQVLCEQLVNTAKGDALVLTFPVAIDVEAGKVVGALGQPQMMRTPFQVMIPPEFVHPYREGVARAIQATLDAAAGFDDDGGDDGDPDLSLDGAHRRN